MNDKKSKDSVGRGNSPDPKPADAPEVKADVKPADVVAVDEPKAPEVDVDALKAELAAAQAAAAAEKERADKAEAAVLQAEARAAQAEDALVVEQQPDPDPRQAYNKARAQRFAAKAAEARLAAKTAQHAVVEFDGRKYGPQADPAKGVALYDSLVNEAVRYDRKVKQILSDKAD